MKKLTKKQRDLLVWLAETERIRSQRKQTGRDDPVLFAGGNLIDYYAEQRARRDKAAGLQPPLRVRGGGYAQHGWRRAGGTALKRLAETGSVVMVEFRCGVPQYKLTDAGRAAVASD